MHLSCRKKHTGYRRTAVSGSDHRLIFRSAKPQRLVSQPSLLLSHATWKQVCSSIHLSTFFFFFLNLSACRSLPLCLSFPFSHIPPLLFSHLATLPHLTLCALRLTSLLFSSLAPARFFIVFLSHLLFLISLRKLSFLPSGPRSSSNLAGL